MATCSRCGGSGKFVGRNGRTLGACFRCNGEGSFAEFGAVGIGRKAAAEVNRIHASGGMTQFEAMPALPRLVPTSSPAPAVRPGSIIARMGPGAQRLRNQALGRGQAVAVAPAPAVEGSHLQQVRQLREAGASFEAQYASLGWDDDSSSSVPDDAEEVQPSASFGEVEPTGPIVEHELHTIRNGYFTVVLGGEYGRVTLRIQDDNWTVDKDRGLGKPGQQCISYLNGSDNWRNYKGFAFVNGTAVRPYQSAPERALTALHFLLGAPVQSLKVAAEAYALESNRCSRCHRMLTVPASIASGLGPDCATKSDY